MAEPKKPNQPLPGTPGAPLPRLWKLEPDPDEVSPRKSKKAKARGEGDDAPAKPGKAKKSEKGSKSGKSPKEGEEKHVLKEETPRFDTHETRQRIRLLFGTGLTVLMLTVGYLVYRFVVPADNPEQETPVEIAMVPAKTGASQLDEEEARSLLDRARDVARNKNLDLAIEILTRVKTKYPKTAAAREAVAALDRPHQNPPLPLFLDRPAVVAKPGENGVAATPAIDPAPVNVVDATKTPTAGISGSAANLELPANTPEVATSSPPSVANPAASIAMKPLPRGFRAREGTEIDASGWPLEIVGDRDGAPMLLVPGGTFIQGRENADPNEGPAHQVSLSTYYIDKHETTVRQFNLFQKEAGRRGDRDRALARDPLLANLDSEEDRPVVLVSAREAKDYADWAGKTLPTEAQWEAAARTPDGRIYPWGADRPQWTRPRAPRQIDPVMSFPLDVSPYGVFDLAGNAWEWTGDWYDPRYYQQFKTATADDPRGAIKPRSLQLVIKGIARDWSVSKRDGFKFDTRLPYLGFRCTLPAEKPHVYLDAPASPAGPGQPAAPAGNRGGIVPF